MSPDELKTLIESDEQASQYWADRRDAACAARCSVIAPPVRKPVPAEDIQYDAALNGVWAGITIARESSETPQQIRGICITFLDWIKSGRPIDFDMPEVQQMLGGLVLSGLVTQEQADSLALRADTPQTFTTDDVQQAMGA
jgi:hypothetical protein